VRAQVEREAEHVAGAVADATGAAIERAATARLASLRAEVAQLEQRVRAASRIVAEQRAHDRRLLGGIAAGVASAIALLVVLVARGPGVAPAAVPPPEPIRVEPASLPPIESSGSAGARSDAERRGGEIDARPIDTAPPDAPPPLDAAPSRPSRRR
jgi:hypothetical protein